MKKIKFSPVVIVSIGLLLASLGVLGNWAYTTFFKGNEDNADELIVLKPIDSSRETMKPTTDHIERNKKNVSTQKTPEEIGRAHV